MPNSFPDSSALVPNMAAHLRLFVRLSLCSAGVLRKQRETRKVAALLFKVSSCSMYSSSSSGKVRVNGVYLHYERN